LQGSIFVVFRGQGIPLLKPHEVSRKPATSKQKNDVLLRT